ncbi:MAG: hypothetical protein HYR91_12315 [Flavobacteriia bacterium]|nr:hypothetical protein [Flavobacteriia bacterium]
MDIIDSILQEKKKHFVFLKVVCILFTLICCWSMWQVIRMDIQLQRLIWYKTVLIFTIVLDIGLIYSVLLIWKLKRKGFYIFLFFQTIAVISTAFNYFYNYTYHFNEIYTYYITQQSISTILVTKGTFFQAILMVYCFTLSLQIVFSVLIGVHMKHSKKKTLIP